MAKGVALIQKKKWVKAQEHMVKASLEEKIEMAGACGECKERETYDILAQLIRVDNRDLQLACVRAMEKTADSRNSVHLSWLREAATGESEQLLRLRAVIPLRG